MNAAGLRTAIVAADVLRLADVSGAQLDRLLARFGLQLRRVLPAAAIPGSYWGESEAGLLANVVYARIDTPLHSLLHEACHYVCMDGQRRAVLNRDAGGDYAEENAVCYLQILLADHIKGFGRDRMFADMDAWGYTFRLGSAQAWFEQEAEEARDWLLHAGLVSGDMQPTWRLRN